MNINAATLMQQPGFRKIEWLPRDIAVERRPDGVIIMQSRIPLKAYEKHIPASLAKWAVEKADRTWLAQRSGPDRQWRKLSFAEAKRSVDALTQGILNLKLPEGRPVAILSGNSIEHALMTLAAMQARISAAPVSPAYSLMSQDHAKLKYLFALIKPALVMVQDCPASSRRSARSISTASPWCMLRGRLTASRASRLPTSRRPRSRPTSKTRSQKSRRRRSENCCSPQARRACRRR
jgi:feruloyl-CoA synthase